MNSLLRAVKGSTKSHVENLVRDVTKNEPHAATTSQLLELANVTFSKEGKEYQDLITTLFQRLKHFECPQHVYKSLILVRYLLLNGDPRFVNEMRQCSHLHELLEYHFYSKNEEIGHNIRVKTDEIIAILTDNELLREERAKSRAALQRILGFTAQEMYSTPTASVNVKGSAPFNQFDPHMETATQQQRVRIHDEDDISHDHNNNHQHSSICNINNNNNTDNPTQNGNYPDPSPIPQLEIIHLTPHQSNQHGFQGEQGYVSQYDHIVPDTVTTPRKKIQRAEDVVIGKDISGDMFLMCSPMKKKTNYDPFDSLQRVDPFTEGPTNINNHTIFEHGPNKNSNSNQLDQMRDDFARFSLDDDNNHGENNTNNNNNNNKHSNHHLNQNGQNNRHSRMSTVSNASTSSSHNANQSPAFPPQQSVGTYTRQTTRGQRGSITASHQSGSESVLTTSLPAPNNTIQHPTKAGDVKDDFSINDGENWTQFSPMGPGVKFRTNGGFFPSHQQPQQQHQQQHPSNQSNSSFQFPNHNLNLQSQNQQYAATRSGSFTTSVGSQNQSTNGPPNISHFNHLPTQGRQYAQHQPHHQQQQQQSQTPQLMASPGSEYDAFANLPMSNDNPLIMLSPDQRYAQQRRASTNTYNPAQLADNRAKSPLDADPMDDLVLPF